VRRETAQRGYGRRRDPRRLADFYRTRYDLITDAITAEQAQHRAAHADRRAELATVRAQITNTDQASDRYLTAFENGTMDEELVADRLTALRARLKELRARRDDLTTDLDDGPAAPDAAALAEVADHIGDVIAEGSHNQTKALIEALVAKVTITGPNRLVPFFRIPQPRNANEAASALPAETAPKEWFAQ
jgi:site-specific DNA recombinase